MDRPRDALPEGAKLAGYVIGHVLGRGGFGVTYFGSDALFPDTKVAIKEFLPAGLAVREAGVATVHPSGREREAEFRIALSRFEDEARTLVALRHPNVVEVQRYVEANGTAYVVMKFEEGRSLAELLSGGKVLAADRLGEIVRPLLDGLEAVHRRNYLHRDIKPGNIFIRDADGSPVYLDFGAARQAMGADRKTSLTEIVTPGYAPFEQYFRKGEQGPWTDIYALGATLYRCIAGEAPPEAPERTRADHMRTAREVGIGHYPERFLAAVDAALAVDEKKRPQSVPALRALMGLDTSGASRPPDPGATLMAGEPPHLNHPPAAAIPQRAPLSGRPPWFGAIILLFIVAIIAAAYLSSGSGSPAPQPDRADVAPPATSQPKPVTPLGSATVCHDGSGWRAGCVFRDCADCPEMVVIPAGTFTMGSPATEASRMNSEGPQHGVTIAKPFALGKYEVTFDEWDACVEARGCASPLADEGWGRGRRPVIHAKWEHAKAYTAWLSSKTGRSYRLPSEAEWEYAARAGTTTPFSTGATISTDQANYDGNYVFAAGQKGAYRQQTVSVGSFAPNRFGLHDMHGNVLEWIEDCWNDSYVGAPVDGRAWLTGNCTRHVLRGGSWYGSPRSLRSANRDRYVPDLSPYGYGFRLARALE